MGFAVGTERSFTMFFVVKLMTKNKFPGTEWC